MKTNILATMSNTSVEVKKAAERAEVILLGIDVHAEKQVVVRQIDGQKVKIDKRDAKAMTGALNRYTRGNKRALCVVRVPSEEEEQRRSLSRQRDALARESRRLAAIGHSHALYYGERLKGRWWWVQPEATTIEIISSLPLRQNTADRKKTASMINERTPGF